MAAARGVRGWFDPPLCLFSQLPELLGVTRAACGDYERLVLLASVLRSAAPRVFSRLSRPDAFVDALDRLFGELAGEGVTADALPGALARAGRDAFEINRDADLAAAYDAYLAALAAQGLRDDRARWIDAAAAVRNDAPGLARRLGQRRELRLFGLQDLRAGWRTLLEALRASPALDAITVHTSAPLHTDEALDADVVTVLDDTSSLARRLFTVRDAPFQATTPRLEIFSSPDAEREAEQVAVRVRALLDGGAPPERIAVVARSARPWVDLVLDALAHCGVSATARRRHSFASIPVVRSVLSLFAVARDGWPRHGLVELAEQPYLGIDLDATVLNYIGYRRRVEGLDDWMAAHERLLAEVEARERKHADDDAEPDRRRMSLPPGWRVRRAVEAFRRFAGFARPLDSARPLHAWLDWLLALLGADTRVEDDASLPAQAWDVARHVYDAPDGCEDVVRLDAAGLRGAQSVIAEWRRALERWRDVAPLSVAGFAGRLQSMLSGDAALWTRARRSVQVLEGLAAAHRAFDHVFLVGMAGGRFPLPMPRSPILGEIERARLASVLPLDTSERWDTRERELFRVLVAGARASLTVSWPRLDERGGETVPSAFLEELLDVAGALPLDLPTHEVRTMGVPLIADAAAVPLALHAATIEGERATGRLSPWNGLITNTALRAALGERLGPEYVWSPTQLESYAKCPWAWFSARLLHLEKLSDPDVDIDPRARGSLLHDALRRFFDSARERFGRPVFLLPGDLDAWARTLLHESLETALAAVADEVWLGQPALRLTKRAELRRMLDRFLEGEAEYNEKLLDRPHWTYTRTLRMAAAAHELAFDELRIRAGGEMLRLRGTIDRVDVSCDDRVAAADCVAAIDYKTTKWSTPGSGEGLAWSDGVVLQVPLYAEALLQLRPGSRVARVAYRAIRSRDLVHKLDLLEVKGSRGHLELTRNTEGEQKLERALDAVAQHVRAARAGEFPADPAPSCKCPTFCHAWEICRVRGGPQAKW